MWSGSREVPTVRESTSAPEDLHCSPVFVRLVLLIVLAVATATGRGGPADVVTADSIGALAEVADGEPMDALGVELVQVTVPSFQLIPLVLHGTEVEHPSPEAARVFRPPRASFA